MSDTDRQLLLVLQEKHDRYKAALERIAKMPLAPGEVNCGTRKMKNIAKFALRETNSRKMERR